MNTPGDIEYICNEAGLQRDVLETVSDPTYLAVNEALFRASLLAEQLLETVYPQGRVHLVGMYRKPD